MAFRAVAAQEVPGSDGVLDLGVVMLDHALDGMRATQRIRRVGGQRTTVIQSIRTEDAVRRCRDRVG
jgi:hypothetical protein